MGLAPLLSSHALWQVFYIAWVLSLIILPLLPKSQMQLPLEARLLSRALGLV